MLRDEIVDLLDFENLQVDILSPEFEIVSVNEDYQEVVKFIKDNYHDDKSDFQIEYTKDYFLWYFNCSESDFILLKFNGKVIGCVSGKADFIIIKNIPKKVYILNHLCIDKTFRHCGIIKTLIKEIAKCSLKRKIYYAFYTSGYNHLTPLNETRIYNCYKTPEYLEEVGYISLPCVSHLKNLLISLYKPKKGIKSDLVIHQNKEDIRFVSFCLNKKYSTYDLAQHFHMLNEKILSERKIVTTFTFLKNEIIVGFSAFYNANLVHKKTSKRIKRSYLLAHWNDKNFLSEKELLTNSFNMIEADIVSVVGTGLFSSKSVRISLKIDNYAEKYYSYFYKSSDIALDNKKMYLFIP